MLALRDTFPKMTGKSTGRTWPLMTDFFSLTNFLVEKLESNGEWNDREFRQAFLRGFAHKMGFDPSSAEQWRNRMKYLRAHGVIIFPHLFLVFYPTT